MIRRSDDRNSSPGVLDPITRSPDHGVPKHAPLLRILGCGSRRSPDGPDRRSLQNYQLTNLPNYQVLEGQSPSQRLGLEATDSQSAVICENLRLIGFWLRRVPMAGYGGPCVLLLALGFSRCRYQGTASVVPIQAQKAVGFSPWRCLKDFGRRKSTGAKAQENDHSFRHG